MATRLQNEHLTRADVIKIGLKLVAGLYKCTNKIITLNEYMNNNNEYDISALHSHHFMSRYILFIKKVAKSKKSVRFETLPPTEDAAGHHLLRVYRQISQ